MKADVEVTIRATIEVPDDAVLRCTENHDDWRGTFYDLATPEEVFEHLAFNLVRHDRALSMLDGWADLAAAAAKVTDEQADVLVRSVSGFPRDDPS